MLHRHSPKNFLMHCILACKKMPINLSSKQISAAIPNVREGLDKYRWLQRQVGSGGAFHQDLSFRRRFNHFYRVRRGPEWQEHFYELMGSARGKGLTFEFVLNDLRQATSRFEASFSSKLYATINPAAPVIDSIVLRNVGLRLPYVGAADRSARICQVHAALSSIFDAYLNTRDGAFLVGEFDHAYPFAKDELTAQKKLDLVLWQTR